MAAAAATCAGAVIAVGVCAGPALPPPRPLGGERAGAAAANGVLLFPDWSRCGLRPPLAAVPRVLLQRQQLLAAGAVRQLPAMAEAVSGGGCAARRSEVLPQAPQLCECLGASLQQAAPRTILNKAGRGRGRSVERGGSCRPTHWLRAAPGQAAAVVCVVLHSRGRSCCRGCVTVEVGDSWSGS